MTTKEKKETAQLIRANFLKSVVLTEFTIQWAKKRNKSIIGSGEGFELSKDLEGLNNELQVHNEKLSALDEYIKTL